MSNVKMVEIEFALPAIEATTAAVNAAKERPFNRIPFFAYCHAQPAAFGDMENQAPAAGGDNGAAGRQANRSIT